MDHAGTAEVVHLRERFGLVVALLVGRREERIGLGDDIVFQLAHCLEGEAGGLVEGVLRAQQRLVRGAVEGLAILVEETAQEAQGGNLVERVHEGRPIPRDDVQVTVARFDEGGEQAGAVDPLALGEDRLGVGEAVHGEIQRLDAPVFRGIHKVDHPDFLLPDEGEHIGPGEVFRHFAQESDHLVGVEFNQWVHY